MTAIVHPISIFSFPQPDPSSVSPELAYPGDKVGPRDLELEHEHEHDLELDSTTTPSAPHSDNWATDENQGLSPSSSKTSSSPTERDHEQDQLVDEDDGERGTTPKTPVEMSFVHTQESLSGKGLGLEGLDSTGVFVLNTEDLPQEDTLPSILPVPGYSQRKKSIPGQPPPVPPLNIDPPTPTFDQLSRFASPPNTTRTIQTMIMPCSSSISTSIRGGEASEPVSPLSTGSSLPTPSSEDPPSPASGAISPYTRLGLGLPLGSTSTSPNPGLLSPNSIKNKRLSRKQAPALTESLENLTVGSTTTLPGTTLRSAFGAVPGIGGSGVDEWGGWKGLKEYDGKSPVDLGWPVGKQAATAGLGVASVMASPTRKAGVYTTTSARRQEDERRTSSTTLGLGNGGSPAGTGRRRSSEEEKKEGGKRKSAQFLSFVGFGRRKSDLQLEPPLNTLTPTTTSTSMEESPVKISVEAPPRLPPIVVDGDQGVQLKVLPSTETLPHPNTMSSLAPPARMHVPRRFSAAQRERKRINPPLIPARMDSLPLDPASSRAVLSLKDESAKDRQQLPLDHFSFGQTEGDAIVKLNDDRRPSEQTFMTGYSLGGGAGGVSTDDERMPSGTIDLNTDDDRDEQVRDRARSMVTLGQKSAMTSTPVLFTRVSSTTTTTARPREDLPFGRSRRNEAGGSGASTPSEVQADDGFTPKAALTPSSSFIRHAQAKAMSQPHLAQYVRSESRPSMKSVVAKRRPVQWAELDALEEEEARLRAEQRREDRERRDKDKKEGKTRPVIIGRRTSAKRAAASTARGNKSGTSTDTSSDGTKLKREGFRERRSRLKREAELFDALQNTIPGQDDLMAASMVEIRDDQGTKIEFGKLIQGGVGKRYVVIFIRHWYCPLCAQYTESIIRTIDQEPLDRAQVELIIIGNGSYKMIPGYSKSIKCPFKMYTDSKLRLYKALGMTRQTGDAGAEDEKGDYVRMSNLESTWQVAKRATKMPLKNPGHFTQIGGEFIFGGPTECTYAHRMSNTRNHAPIRDIVALAGVHLDFYHGERGPPPPEIHRPRMDGDTPDGMMFGNWGESGIELTQAERYAMESRRESEGEGWLVAREEELERVRLARQGRRSNAGLPGEACMPQILSDSEAELDGPRSGPGRRGSGAGGLHRTSSRFVEMIDSPVATTIEERSEVEDSREAV